MKGHIWVVAANSSQARIFHAENNRHLVEHNSLVHPESRMKGSDLETDRPGVAYESHGTGRHMVQEHTPIKEQEAIHFARELAKELDKAINSGATSKIYIAAGPSFLGILRKQLSPAVQKAVAAEINKDIAMLPLEKIRELLPAIL